MARTPHPRRFCKRCKSGPLAQLVEHWTFNPLVAGSIPARPTNSDKDLHSVPPVLSLLWDPFCYRKCRACHRVIASANPPFDGLKLRRPSSINTGERTASRIRDEMVQTSLCVLAATSPVTRSALLNTEARNEFGHETLDADPAAEPRPSGQRPSGFARPFTRLFALVARHASSCMTMHILIYSAA